MRVWDMAADIGLENYVGKSFNGSGRYKGSVGCSYRAVLAAELLRVLKEYLAD